MPVGGVSGDGGLGGTGTTAMVPRGAAGGRAAGRALIEAAGAETPAAINLGVTTIAANGDIAGRIEMRTAGAAGIRMTA